MKAVVKSLELKKKFNKQFLRILLSSEGKEYILSDPQLSDPINFRKQIFGILSACNCYDFTRLANSNPIPLEAISYYVDGRGIKIIENKYGEWFRFDKERGIYICEKADKKTKNFIEMSQKHNISKVEITNGTIESIKSASGVLQMLFKGERSAWFTTGQVYFGFGYPICIGDESNNEDTLKSATAYKSFITSMMKFYRQSDLLKLGGNIEKYPEVEITLGEKNQVDSITNHNTGLGLSIGKSFEVIKAFKDRKYKQFNSDSER